MVRKGPRLQSKKPTAPPQEAESWINKGGVDPESSKHVSTETSAKATTETPKTEGKPYPHRISFDMSTAQYKRLKFAAFDRDRTMNEILREAVEDWMKAREY
jgi:hypothetical protein